MIRNLLLSHFLLFALVSCAQQPAPQQTGTLENGVPSKENATSNTTLTPHGYRFVHHRKNEGPKPKVGETALFFVNVWAGKTLLQRSKGAGFRLEIVDPSRMGHVPPMMDAAFMMSRGDSATVYQKVDAQMRDALPQEAKDAEELRFELVLNGIISAEANAKIAEQVQAMTKQIEEKVQTTAKSYASGLLNAQLKKTPSGLKYYVETAGEGAAVKEGEALQVHYFGVLKDGTPFDNSFAIRKPLVFPAGGGQMIPGFDQGVMQLRHGDKAYLFIPPSLGFGDQESGFIPPNSELIFYVEIL